MEPISLVVGGVLLLVGFLLGKANRRKQRPTLDTKCPGCQHDLSYRDPETGQCTKTVEQASRWDRYGSEIAYTRIPCECHNHVTADQILLDASWKALPSPRPPAAGGGR